MNNEKKKKFKLKIEEKNTVVSSTTTNDSLATKSLKKRSRKTNNIIEDETVVFHNNTDESTNNFLPTSLSLSSSIDQSNVIPGDILCLLICWVVYVLIWHGVLSNIPLSSPMPYGVHARYISLVLLKL